MENKRLKEENLDLKEKHSHIKNDATMNRHNSVQSLSGKIVEDSIPSLINKPSSLMKSERGKLFKGTPYQYRKINLEDKSKIAELSAKLEDAQQMVMIQKLEIRSLKEKFISLVNDRNKLLSQLELGSRHDIAENYLPMTPNNEGMELNGESFLPNVKK